MIKEQKTEIEVSDDYSGLRLDKALIREFSTISREKIQKIILKGMVTVDKKRRKPAYPLKKGQLIEIQFEPEKNELKHFDFKVNIIFEDDYIIVVDKPSGLSVHGPNYEYQKTLVAALLSMKRELWVADTLRPGVVHRLDKDTTGLMVLAKNKKAYESLVRQFKDRTVSKEYRAVCHGQIEHDSLSLELPLARDRRNPLKMKVSFFQAKQAQTRINVLKRFKTSTYLSIKILTGRMHQIRVHLRFIGHPILGDKKYGLRDKEKHLYLHAHKLSFIHPKDNKLIEFSSCLPDYFSGYLKKEDV
ncbi:MAG: RluA family pseudouridine synthase [Candidatus Omnitrophica bacterium]|nr:RluA family pseudouridine synthase [Candidatus Omnitrophota bacterium]